MMASIAGDARCGSLDMMSSLSLDSLEAAKLARDAAAEFRSWESLRQQIALQPTSSPRSRGSGCELSEAAEEASRCSRSPATQAARSAGASDSGRQTSVGDFSDAASASFVSPAKSRCFAKVESSFCTPPSKAKKTAAATGSSRMSSPEPPRPPTEMVMTDPRSSKVEVRIHVDKDIESIAKRLLDLCLIFGPSESGKSLRGKPKAIENLIARIDKEMVSVVAARREDKVQDLIGLKDIASSCEEVASCIPKPGVVSGLVPARSHMHLARLLHLFGRPPLASEKVRVGYILSCRRSRLAHVAFGSYWGG